MNIKLILLGIFIAVLLWVLYKSATTKNEHFDISDASLVLTKDNITFKKPVVFESNVKFNASVQLSDGSYLTNQTSSSTSSSTTTSTTTPRSTTSSSTTTTSATTPRSTSSSSTTTSATTPRSTSSSSTTTSATTPRSTSSSSTTTSATTTTPNLRQRVLSGLGDKGLDIFRRGLFDIENKGQGKNDFCRIVGSLSSGYKLLCDMADGRRNVEKPITSLLTLQGDNEITIPGITNALPKL